MNLFASMNVSRQLALSFAIPLLMGMGLAVFSITEMRTLQREVQEVATERLGKMEDITAIKDHVRESSALVAAGLLVADAGQRDATQRQLQALRAGTDRRLAALDKSLVTQDARDLLKTLVAANAAYVAAADQVLMLAAQGDLAAAIRLLNGPLRERQDVLVRALDASAQVQRKLSAGLAQHAADSASRDAVLLVAFAVLMAAVGGVLAWAITRRLTRALGAEPAEVNEAVARVAAGDLVREIRLRPGDTTSIMASVRRMQQALESTVARVRGNADSVATASMQITQGNLQQSGNTLDVAIRGNGFFQVTMPDGSNAYTRDGSFQVDAQGRLVTSTGLPVAGGVTIPAGAQSITISADGAVSVVLPGSTQPQPAGSITLTAFVNPAGLEPRGQNLFTETNASGAPQPGTPGANGLGQLQQGYVETSNVNVVQELVAMIQTQRAYEMNSKAVQASDQMLQRLGQL